MPFTGRLTQCRYKEWGKNIKIRILEGSELRPLDPRKKLIFKMYYQLKCVSRASFSVFHLMSAILIQNLAQFN